MKIICGLLFFTLFALLNSEVANASILAGRCTSIPEGVTVAQLKKSWDLGEEIVNGGDCRRHICMTTESWVHIDCSEPNCYESDPHYTEIDNSKPYPGCCRKCL